MSDTFDCPNCGAPLDYHGSDPIIRCSYCSTSVIVPKNLREKPMPSQAQQAERSTEPYHQPEQSYGSAASDRRARKATAKRAKERQAAQSKLKKLKELHTTNMISESEYEQQRAEILKEL